MRLIKAINASPGISVQGVTLQVVQVVINAINQSGGNPDVGTLLFSVNDIVWVDAINTIAAIDPIELSANGGLIRTVAVNLLAMDNPGISTNWYWTLTGTLNGQAIPPRKLSVNFANGPQQTLTSLLDTATLIA
jgi:hypothetical protein